MRELTTPSRSLGANSATGWTVNAAFAKRGAVGQVVCITESRGAWAKLSECDLRNPGVERLLLDPWTKTVYVFAQPPRANQISEVGTSDPLNGWECFRGTFGTSFRTEDDYSICSSAFRKNVAGTPEMLIGNMLNVMTGTVRTRVLVDKAAVLDAVNQSGVLSDVESYKLNSELATYRSKYQAAVSVWQLRAFINDYKSNDPDGLISAAQERLANAEQAALTQQERSAGDARASLARLSLFQENLKPGEMVQWYPNPEAKHRKGIGLVTKVENQLVQVQFENLIIGGTSLRFVKRSELEPWDGQGRGMRNEIR